MCERVYNKRLLEEEIIIINKNRVLGCAHARREKLKKNTYTPLSAKTAAADNFGSAVPGIL